MKGEKKTEEEKCTSWEEDQNEEVRMQRVVLAPNGKHYKIRGLSALENTRILDATIKYSSSGRERGEGNMNFSMDTVKNQCLTLRAAVIEPDFSKHSLIEIEEWMGKKGATVTFLINEIGKMSGFREVLPENI